MAAQPSLMEPRELPLWVWGLHTCSAGGTSHTLWSSAVPLPYRPKIPNEPQTHAQSMVGVCRHLQRAGPALCPSLPRVLLSVHPAALISWMVRSWQASLGSAPPKMGSCLSLDIQGTLLIPEWCWHPNSRSLNSVKATARLFSEALSHWSSVIPGVTKLVFGVRQQSHSRVNTEQPALPCAPTTRQHFLLHESPSTWHHSSGPCLPEANTNTEKLLSTQLA